MTAKYPLITNGNLSREQGAPESTRMMQQGSRLVEATEVVESRVLGWAASFSAVGRAKGRLNICKFSLPSA